MWGMNRRKIRDKEGFARDWGYVLIWKNNIALLIYGSGGSFRYGTIYMYR